MTSSLRNSPPKISQLILEANESVNKVSLYPVRALNDTIGTSRLKAVT